MLFFLSGICISALLNNAFSQNLSLEELINLQQISQTKASKLLSKNEWINDNKDKSIWYHGNSIIDSANAVLVNRSENCSQNIIYYVLDDSSHYIKLKNEVAQLSDRHFYIKYPNSRIYDFKVNDLNYRFYNTYELNQSPLYSLWIFSKQDNWFYSGINKFCYKKVTSEKRSEIKAINDSLIEPPEFPGGDEGRITYLMKNIIYPKKARENGIQGTVYVTFVIDTDGSISEVNILKGIGGGCDEEVIRLIREMPQWRPGTENEIPVRIQYNMPVKFTLGPVD